MNKLKILGLIELLFYRDSLDNKQCTEQPNYTASEKLTRVWEAGNRGEQGKLGEYMKEVGPQARYRAHDRQYLSRPLIKQGSLPQRY